MTYMEKVFNYMYDFNSNPVFENVKSPNGKPCIETAEPKRTIQVIHKGKKSKIYPSKNKGQCLYEVSLGDCIHISEKVLETLWIRDYKIIRITHNKIITRPC